MRQVFQNMANGNTDVIDIPSPGIKPGYLLIRNVCSLLSSGTERMLVQFGKSNLIDKALSQPEKVQDVFDKVRTDGLGSTIDAVHSNSISPCRLIFQCWGCDRHRCWCIRFSSW